MFWQNIDKKLRNVLLLRKQIVRTLYSYVDMKYYNILNSKNYLNLENKVRYSQVYESI